MDVLKFIYGIQDSVNNLAYSIESMITYVIIGIFLFVLAIFAIYTLVNHLNNETDNDIKAAVKDQDQEQEDAEERIKYN